MVSGGVQKSQTAAVTITLTIPFLSVLHMQCALKSVVHLTPLKGGVMITWYSGT